jgi:uncharacterized protein (TIGR00725 family)
MTVAATLSAHTIGVIGSGTHEHDRDARPIGELLADLGVNLLTGGGAGVMKAVSRAFVARNSGRGICIGIIPCASEADRGSPRRGYPNEFVQLAIHTHLPYSGTQGTHDLSRNHINVLTCSAIVALPGEDGTLSEASLAIRYARPIVAFSSTAALLERFPTEIRRVAEIHHVEAFLRARIDIPAHRL